MDERLFRGRRIPIVNILTIGILPSFVKILFYRFQGKEISFKAKIGFGSVIIGEKVRIKEGVKINFGTIVRGRNINIESGVSVGPFALIDTDNINIGRNVTIRELVQIGGLDTEKSSFDIGEWSNIRQNCLINTSYPVTIGKHTAVGGFSLLFTHSSWQSMLEGYPVKFSPIIIGDNVSIAWGVFIIPGIRIDNNSLIAARSVVTINIPENCVARGNPAEIVIKSGDYPRKLSRDEKKLLIDYFFNELYNFLEYHGFKINRIKFLEYDVVEIFGKVKTKKIKYIVINLKDLKVKIPDQYTKEESLIYSSDTNDFDIRQIIKYPSMILDFNKSVFHNKNTFGSYILEFFQRFGIRFDEF